MSDAPLTDDDLREKIAILPADWTVTILAKECLEHRAARAADRERVRQLVAEVVEHALSDDGPARHDLIIEFVATRVADALAVPRTACEVEPASSRACERGTKSCIVRHIQDMALRDRIAELVANDDLTSGQLRAELRKLVGQ